MRLPILVFMGFPGGLNGKESTCKAGDTKSTSSTPGLGRPPGGGHGNPLQYSCLENPMDRGAQQAIVHRVTKSRTCLKRPPMYTCTYIHDVLSVTQDQRYLNTSISI